MKSFCSIASLLFITFLVMNFHSSDAIVRHAKLTLNGFEKGEDGGGESACDGKYHSDDTLVVALSTEWYKGRCFKKIRINGNGHSAVAEVVDECDTSAGCDSNIVDASRAVWEALRVPKSKWGELSVTWTDV